MIRELLRLSIKDWSPLIRRKHETLMSYSRRRAVTAELSAELEIERVTQATRHAVARYAMRKYPGRILNIVASKRYVAETVSDTRHAWPEFGGEGSKTVQVAATNSGHLLVTPHVEEVNEYLQAFLAEDTQHESTPLARVI